MFSLDRRVGAAVFKRNFILAKRDLLMKPTIKDKLMSSEHWEIGKFREEGWA